MKDPRKRLGLHDPVEASQDEIVSGDGSWVRTDSQMKIPQNGAVHLKVTYKSDRDINKHYTDSPDPDTLIKANPFRAITGLSPLAYTAGSCPMRTLQESWPRMSA